MKKISLLIIDDHTLIREAWSALLQMDGRFAVIGLAGSAEEGIRLAGKLQPEIVIMDINLPGMSGIEAIPYIKEVSNSTKVLGVSMHTQLTYAQKMLNKGASGYVTKNSPGKEMITALLAVHSGEKYICREIKILLSDEMISTEDGKG
jgi:DNA-binding NarL/FixJ family response regulator